MLLFKQYCFLFTESNFIDCICMYVSQAKLIQLSIKVFAYICMYVYTFNINKYSKYSASI